MREARVTRRGLDGLYLLTEKASAMAGTFLGGDKGARALVGVASDRDDGWRAVEDAPRQARDTLGERGARVAALQVRAWPEVAAVRTRQLHTVAGGAPLHFAPFRHRTLGIARRLGIPALDPSAPLPVPGPTHREPDPLWAAVGLGLAAEAARPVEAGALLGGEPAEAGRSSGARAVSRTSVEAELLRFNFFGRIHTHNVTERADTGGSDQARIMQTSLENT
ncbi:MAG: hypothetical protein AMXMBFR64_39030 [Myxococcales bacterium]